MEQGGAGEKVKAVQNIELLRCKKAEKTANDEQQTSADQPQYVIFTDL